METGFEAKATAVSQALTPTVDPLGAGAGQAADHVIQNEDGEMQGKTTAASLPPSQWLKLKRLTVASVSEDVEQLDRSYTPDGNTEWYMGKHIGSLLWG